MFGRAAHDPVTPGSRDGDSTRSLESGQAAAWRVTLEELRSRRNDWVWKGRVQANSCFQRVGTPYTPVRPPDGLRYLYQRGR